MTAASETVRVPYPHLLDCPAWCHGQHEQALADGCGEEGSAVHLGLELAGWVPQLANSYTGVVVRDGGGSWGAQLIQDPYGNEEGTFGPMIRLDLRQGTDASVVLPLTTGEARVLARQLERLADLHDLAD